MWDSPRLPSRNCGLAQNFAGGLPGLPDGHLSGTYSSRGGPMTTGRSPEPVPARHPSGTARPVSEDTLPVGPHRTPAHRTPAHRTPAHRTPAHRTPAHRRRHRDATLRPTGRAGVGWRPRRRPRRPARGRRRGPFPARHPRRRGGPRVRGRARPPARRLRPPPPAPPRRPAAHRRRRLHRGGQVDRGEQPGPRAGHPLRGAAPHHPLARARLPSRRRGAGSPTPACCPS